MIAKQCLMLKLDFYALFLPLSCIWYFPTLQENWQQSNNIFLQIRSNINWNLCIDKIKSIRQDFHKSSCQSRNVDNQIWMMGDSICPGRWYLIVGWFSCDSLVTDWDEGRGLSVVQCQSMPATCDLQTVWLVHYSPTPVQRLSYTV